jgi:hypothetical protein
MWQGQVPARSRQATADRRPGLAFRPVVGGWSWPGDQPPTATHQFTSDQRPHGRGSTSAGDQQLPAGRGWVP